MKTLFVLLLTLQLMLQGNSQTTRPQNPELNTKDTNSKNNVWINKLFFKNMIDFVPHSKENPKCNQQSSQYKIHLQNNTLWAVRMHEASIYTLGGILSGNANQFGHPDQCVDTAAPELDISGQYCLATAELEPILPLDTNNADLTQSVWMTFFANHTDLIKHSRSYFRWGVCIPNACSALDLELSLRKSLVKSFQKAGIELRISVTPEYCYSRQSQGPLPVQAWCMLGFLTCVLGLVIWATLRDYLTSVDLPTSLSLSRAFSIIYNTRRLCKVDKDEEMTIIYGIKTLTMFTVVIGHKFVLLFGNNVRNKDRIERDTVNFAYLYFLNGSVVVDTFFVISGYLSAHQLVQHFSRSKHVPFVLVVLDRIVRIVPTYALVIGFYVWLLPYVNDGPLWNSIVLRESNRCLENWWTNILFINNIVNDDQMCMIQSWFLAVDFQLFLLSFAVIYSAWKWPSCQGWLLGGCLLASVAVPAVLIYEKQEWSFFIPSISNLHDPTQVPHFRSLYTKSYTRAIPYVIGIIGAFYRRHLQRKQYEFSSGTVKSLMLLAAVVGAHLMFLLPFWFLSPHHQYNVWEQVAYAPVHRLIWAAAMCHFIVIHNSGGYGLISMFLGCKVFAPLSRLCYGVYLTHIAIMLIELGSSHTSEYYTLISVTQDILGDLLMSLMASFVLNLLIESPLDTFHKKLKRTILDRMQASKKTSVYPVSAVLSVEHARAFSQPTAKTTTPTYTLGGER